jgi:cystathionine beta-lyase/cystathionine gamma-synthase
MLAFSVAGGLAEALGVLNRMQLATYAVSLGDLDTLVEHPGTMTHGNVDPATRARMGIPDNLIRVSVGVEDPQDLIDDFQQALAGL